MKFRRSAIKQVDLFKKISRHPWNVCSNYYNTHFFENVKGFEGDFLDSFDFWGWRLTKPPFNNDRMCHRAGASNVHIPIRRSLMKRSCLKSTESGSRGVVKAHKLSSKNSYTQTIKAIK